MFVKICGLRSAEDVASAVDAGADAVGFVFHPQSMRNIAPQEAATAASATPAHIKRVAVMRHPSNDEWQTVLNSFAPDVLQTDAEDFESLDVPEHVERCPVHREQNEPIKVSTTLIRNSGIKVVDTLIDVFVYEGAQSGAGETVDWQRAAEVAKDGGMILAGGLGTANVAEAIATVRPYGVDVSSGVESAPGVKDATLIKEFVTAAKAAGRNL